MVPPAKPDKIMSSRLLTMKFMQRAAASAPSAPSTPDGPPAKRQRLSNGTATPTTPTSDLEAVQAALAAEELKRTQAIERQAAEAGETRWVLSFREPEKEAATGALRVVTAGFAAIDSGEPMDGTGEDGDEGVRRPHLPGRKSYGKKPQNPDSSTSSPDDSSASEASEDEDPTGTSALIRQARKEAAAQARAERKAKKKAATAEATRMAEARRSKEVKLNKLTSISGGGGTRSLSANVQCFECGQKGHTKKNCPRHRGKR